MTLDDRLTALETALARETEKRKMLVAEVLVLRAVLIGITTDASGAGHTTAKSRATTRLAAYLVAAEYPPAEAQAALALLDDTFYEIDAARTAAGQPSASS